MSEYMEKHTVSRLVGSPPGYVGYEEGGQLTEAVRRKPFSVVLFDEIEKAHPDVFNTLLQILEEGRLTDAQGRSVDFRNTVLIMTSNLGTADLRKASVGFGKSDEAVTYERMKEKVTDALKQHFRPEFLNRIDEVIVFHELSRDEVIQIVDLMMRRVAVQLESQGIGIEITQSAKQLLAERGYDPTLGARPLRRAIQRLVEDPLSERLLYKEFRAGEIVIVDAEPDPESDKGENDDRVPVGRGLRATAGRARRSRTHGVADHYIPGPCTRRSWSARTAREQLHSLSIERSRSLAWPVQASRSSARHAATRRRRPSRPRRPGTSRPASPSTQVSRRESRSARCIEACRAGGYDLLVLGNRGMTGMTRFLRLGSVPNKVSHHLPCSVLIVKTT